MQPDIFKYGNYRKYLSESFGFSSKKNRTLSAARLARKIGFSDTSSLTKILNGQRHPGSEALDKLCKYLKLKDVERVRLKYLVQLDKVGLTQPDESKRKAISKIEDKANDKFDDFAAWPAAVIHEALRSPYFRLHVPAILEQLRFRASTQTISDCVEKIKHVVKPVQKSKTPKPVTGLTHSTMDQPNFSVRRYQKQVFELAARALESQEIDEREFGTLTFLIDKKKLPEAKETLRKFKMDFLRMYEATVPEKTEHDVYQLNLQLFAMTHLTQYRNNRRGNHGA